MKDGEGLNSVHTGVGCWLNTQKELKGMGDDILRKQIHVGEIFPNVIYSTSSESFLFVSHLFVLVFLL